MPTFKLRKAKSLGALSAEHDNLLQAAFLDSGYLDTLLDPSAPEFLILGRTGAGKTALIKQIRKREGVGVVDPEELSMQHLQNSTILLWLEKSGVNLDIFYKYLWRHVCVLELIRARYEHEEDVPATVSRLFDVSSILSPRKREEKKRRERENDAKSKVLEYLNKYGAEYWIRTDTRIKTITEELEKKLSSDAKLAGKIGGVSLGVTVELGESEEGRTTASVEREVVDRAQQIVSDFLISDLSRTVKLLGEHSFGDQQNACYIVIDDLDKNWMPNQRIYVGLIKALLTTVRELNGSLPAAKIIVALRNDVFRRVFAGASSLEPQREKWRDVQLQVVWNSAQLVQFVDRRLEVVARGEYTKAPPNLKDLLPGTRGKRRKKATEYILERSLGRPRDLLDFLNTCIQMNGAFASFSWTVLHSAEKEYSRRRKAALVEEWRGAYGGLELVLDVVGKIGTSLSRDDLTDDLLDKLFAASCAESCEWLKGLQHRCLNGATFAELRDELFGVLHEVGFLLPNGDCPVEIDVVDPMVGSLLGEEISHFRVHKMFWASFGYFEFEDKQAAG
jgi:hypothetical protein